jgi:hypothetical protein
VGRRHIIGVLSASPLDTSGHEQRSLPGRAGNGLMAAAKRRNTDFPVPILQGVLPIKTAQIPAEIVAGI